MTSVVCQPDPSTADRGSALLSRLFGRLPIAASLSISCLRQDSAWVEDLYDEEHARITRAVDKRRREFATGRAAARTALEAIGVPRTCVPADDTRRPVWPDGVVGSISHSADVAGAVVAMQAKVAAIGLDVESDGALSDGVREMILLPAEFSRPDTVHSDIDAHDKLIFGIKEAIYKCVNPVVDHYFGFHDVEVRFPTAGEFTAHPTGRRSIDFHWDQLNGRYTKMDDLIWTAAWTVSDNF